MYILNNEGINGDRVTGDLIFSYKIPVKGFGFYNMDISASDSFENSVEFKAQGIFVVH